MARNIQSYEIKGTRFKDLTGLKFNSLTVIGLDHVSKYHQCVWLCKCDCGNQTTVQSWNLTSGRKKSCGCLAKMKYAETIRKRCTKHGLNGHPLYHTWKNIRQRCGNPSNNSYGNYGGRGIHLCDEWNDFPTFYDWAIANGWESGLSIERIDNNGDYCPENCRFATLKEQSRNRRKTVFLTYDGVKKPLSEWCEMLGLNMKTCYGRMHDYGWTDPEEILFGRG